MRAFALIALFFCFTTCQAVATEQRLGDILAHARGGICRESAIIDFEKIKKVCGTIIADDGYCTERCAVLLANFKINAEACVKDPSSAIGMGQMEEDLNTAVRVLDSEACRPHLACAFDGECKEMRY
uniref:Uncharacterized protein n=1 Tax=Palpitomonas bilix TaxID=652834 RepID=A0A7S3G6R8_9EUKA|mmetsp:Transcript_26026/g.66086  ORF Transcript_26026/g.66086 Transcript_26026/m.66086 type:complete len:127 (+) Transcript_26026:192-572(+)